MKNNKIQKYEDPEWVEALVEAFLDIDPNELTKNQKRLLRETYFEKINSGLKPKEAIKQAIEIVLCFT